MSEGIISLRERLRKLLGETPADEDAAKERLRTEMASAFEQAGFQIEKDVFDKFKDLSDEEFEQFFKNFKDISRYENLEPSKQQDLLKNLAPFFRDFLFIEEEPPDEDRPKY